MQEYSIYWIKEEVAAHYFHKNELLCRFLKEFQTEPHKLYLKLQFAYITYAFHFEEIANYLKHHCPENTMVRINDNNVELVNNKQEYITLHIEKDNITFRCKSLEEAENILFPTMRSFHPCLFVVGNTTYNHGWLEPVHLKLNLLNQDVLCSLH